MTKTQRYAAFIAYFSAHQPDATTELVYDSPFQLLIAVILSARCTDKRVNMVTPALFAAFPSARDLAHQTAEDVLPYISSVTFPNNKAKYLVSMAKTLVERFGGDVPAEADDLQQLAGVGRKTAHVLASVISQQPKLAVDTHVFRVSKRLGLVSESASTPLAVEKELMQHLPTEYVALAHHWLILHGRYICQARKPLCEECPLTDFCAYFAHLPHSPHHP